MKKISLLFFLFLVLIPSVSAQEGLPLEHVLLSKTQSHPPDSFNVVIMGNGKLIVNPGKIFTTGEEEPGTVLPYLISEPKPTPYPSQALDQGWQGKVILAIEILTDGSVGSYQIMQSCGRSILDEAAIQMVKSWKFQSALQANGQPVRTCIQIPVTFQLQDE